MAIALHATLRHDTSPPAPLRRPPGVQAILIVIAGCCTSGVGADQAKEIPTLEFPKEGPIGPDTYLADNTLVSCTLLNPYPATVLQPWNPTVAQAKAFCSERANCGGIVYRTASANLAQYSTNLATALYCTPRTFVTGTMSSTSGVGFVRYVYGSCDIRVQLASTVSAHYGALAFTRNACIRPGRGISTARDRTPRPDRRKYQAPPKPMVTLSATSYEVGKQVFVNAESARNASADASYHIMKTAHGVDYYMPGQTHATRDQAEMPFTRDGWYPLYLTQAGAQAASIRAYGNGQAHEVGPNSPNGLPSKWLTEPHVQIHWMPSDGSQRLYTGDYVAPFALDGYFPLYRNRVDAEKASSTGLVQSHGPGSSTGHPLSWSTGQEYELYMPGAGPTHYYGDYYDVAEASSPLYSHTAALHPSSKIGVSLSSTSAATVVAYEAMPATPEARAILSTAPNYISR